MTKDPLVSVIMAAYNGADLIGESIESVLGQTYENIELIVVDDCSSDGTADVVDRYVEQYPGKVVLARNSDRAGPCKRRNDALELARGELIAWLDQDDLWMPEKTARQVEVMRTQPDVGLVYSGYDAFDSDSGEVLPWRDRDSEAEGDVLIPLFYEGCFVASLTALFRRDVLTRRGLRLREVDFSFGDDYQLWLALSLDWRVVKIDEVLARYRRHSANESARLGAIDFHQLRINLLREFVAEFPEASRKLGPWRRRGLARNYLRSASFESSRSRARQVKAAAHAFALAPIYTLRSIF